MTVMFLHTARQVLDYIIEHRMSGNLFNNILEMKSILVKNAMINPEDNKLRVIEDITWHKVGVKFDN